MARARNIKPGFFTNDELGELPPLARLLFAGLWTLADREGRLEDRPKKIKAEVLPYDSCDAEELLGMLAGAKFILRYEADGARYIQIGTFTEHQNPHHMEAPSKIPAPDGHANKFNHEPISPKQRARIYARDGHKCVLCSSTADLQIDHIKPVAQGGSSDDDNLRTLCAQCNNKRSKKGKPESNPADSGFSDSTTDSIEPTSNDVGCARPPVEAPALALVEADKPKAVPDCPHQAILALWAEVLPSMPQHMPDQWGGARADHLRARWRETAVAKRWPDQATGLAYLRKLFGYVGQSRFLTGRVKPRDPDARPFLIELEWLVSPGNWARVHEGKYHQEAA